MTKPIINETIVADDPTKVSGSVRLYAQTGGGGVAYTFDSTPLTIGQVIRVSFDANGALKADDGTTALQLNPNVNTSGTNDDAIVTPAGTVWEYTIKYPGSRGPVVRYLSVPDGAGPYNVSAILSTEPDTLLPTLTELDDLADVNTSGVADGNILVYDSATSTWVDGEPAAGGGVEWLTLDTASEWTTAVTAALARDDNTLYLAPGTHVLPFPSGRVIASSKLKVQGAGVDVTQIVVTPDSPQVFSVTDDHNCFTAAAGVDFEMADLNVTGPAVVDPENTSLQTFLFSISQSGSVIVPDSANVTLRFTNIRVNDTSNTNFPTIFQVPGGTGLGRLRMYLEDCDLGRCNAAVSFFGPDSGDRVLYLNRTRFRDAGGYYLYPTYPAYNHTIYMHPSNSVVATDCQFGDNTLGYYIHQFSGGGRTVPNPIDSSFTRCRFGSGSSAINQDAICTTTFDNCDFDGTAPLYLYGTTRFNGCYFDGGDILASTNPCTINASRFVAVTDQGRVGSGDNVSITDTTFEGGALLHSTSSSTRYRLRDCIFTQPNIACSNGQIDIHNARMSGFSGLYRMTVGSATAVLRLFGCDIDASGYAGDHIGGSYAATVSGWGNMVSAGTFVVNATIVDTNLGFIQPGLTPVADVDLANKAYVDSVASSGSPDADETTKGIAELATTTEATTGTDTTRITTPAGVKAVMDAHLAAGDPHTQYLTEAAAASTYQPVDSDLTAIAALTTTAYGRAFLGLANQAATMALLSAAATTAPGIVELATTTEATTGTDTTRAVTAAGVEAVRVAHSIASDPHGDRAYAAALVDDLSGVSNASTARTNLGLGDSAVLDVGATTGTVAAGDDGRFVPSGGTTGDVLVNDGTANGTWETPTVIPDASTTTEGLVELATTAETQAGTDTARAVTPAGLAGATVDLDDLTAAGALADADIIPVNQSGVTLRSTLTLLADYVKTWLVTRALAVAQIKSYDSAHTNYGSFEVGAQTGQDQALAGIKARSTYTNHVSALAFATGFLPPGLYARDDGTDAFANVSLTAASSNWVIGSGNQIRNTADPSNAQDLARKSYVDGRSKNSSLTSTTGPASTVVETIPRVLANGNLASILTSGTLYVVGVELKAGDVVSNIIWASRTTALSAGTHQWSVLLDSSRVVKAVSADDTSGAWGSTSLKTFAMGTPFTIVTTGLYYLGLMVEATTPPSLLGFVNTITLLTGTSPKINATSSTGQTTPPSLAATMDAFANAGVGIPYAYVT